MRWFFAKLEKPHFGPILGPSDTKTPEQDFKKNPALSLQVAWHLNFMQKIRNILLAVAKKKSRETDKLTNRQGISLDLQFEGSKSKIKALLQGVSTAS